MALTIEFSPGATARRPMPVILLVDVSTSMEPRGISEANQGIRDYIDELQKNEDTRESIFLSIITFSDKAQTIIEHQLISTITPPQISAGAGRTNLDKGLEEVLALVKRRDVQFKGAKESLFVLITDGNPNCSEASWKDQLAKMNEHPLIGRRPSGRLAGCRVIAGAGDEDAINGSVLAEFSRDNEKDQVVRLKDQASIGGFLSQLKTITTEINEAKPMSRVIGTQVIN